ncbi:hypothetical protein [Hymenobacter nivis]|uniref:hypothetical protein n=1 Tax=Hymenobacter nivis TaxID=1850093 RepID=UPI001125D5C9|nr:hypothetical protein [Hymenobacter nivis]
MNLSTAYHRGTPGIFLVFALLIDTLTTCVQEKPKFIHPIETSHLLEHAYKAKSQAELTLFFGEWSRNIVAINKEELAQLNSQQKEAYDVFTAFYKPHRLDSLGGSEWGDSIYEKTKFLLVQNDIKIRIIDRIFYSDTYIDSVITGVINRTVKEDSVRKRRLKRVNGKLNQQVREEFGFENAFSFHSQGDEQIDTDSLTDFRPVVKIPGKQIIYLTPKRAETLKAFLGDKHLPIGAGGIMNPARSSGESEKRKKFLENDIKIWYGHWGGYWQLNSYPVAYFITLDKNMLYARVSFRMVYEGGETILKKMGGRWEIISSKRTWIE